MNECQGRQPHRERDAVSKPWSEQTKRLVFIGLVLVFIWAISRLQVLIAPTLIAIILAYLLNPLVGMIVARTGRSRTLVTMAVYLIFLVILVTVPTVLAPVFVQEVRSIDVDLNTTVDQLRQFFERPFTILGFSLDLRTVYDQLSGSLQDIVSPAASGALYILVDVASSVLWLVYIFLVSFYMVKDTDKLVSWLEDLVPPVYRYDIHRLRMEIEDIWDSFFRGQIVVCLLMAALVTVVMAALGVHNALLIGAVAGLLEVLPRIGHTLAATFGVLMAYFLGPLYLPLSNLWFALLVAAVFLIIEEVDINYTLPRIIGRSVHLHPAIVIVGLVIGAIFGGVLGMLLAAPTLSTLRVIGRYVHCKLLDLDPFAERGGNLGQPASETDAAQPDG